MLLIMLGGLCSLAAFVCWVIILIDAFKSELWKGIVGLFCGLYLLYYGITEYQSPNKLPILLTACLGSIVGAALESMGGAFAHRGGV